MSTISQYLLVLHNFYGEPIESANAQKEVPTFAVIIRTYTPNFELVSDYLTNRVVFWIPIPAFLLPTTVCVNWPLLFDLFHFCRTTSNGI